MYLLVKQNRKGPLIRISHYTKVNRHKEKKKKVSL